MALRRSVVTSTSVIEASFTRGSWTLPQDEVGKLRAHDVAHAVRRGGS